MVRYALLLLLLIVAACREYGGAPLSPSRALLPAASIPPPGVGAYGVAALRARPTPASQERLLRFCRAFLASLPSQAEVSERGVPSVRQMVTVWPIEDPSLTPPGHERCDVMLDRYDLFAGQAAIADADAQGRDLSGEGPFLIGWSPSNSRGVPDAVVLVLDMSRFETQQSFDEAMLFWQRRIVEDPELWRSGFDAWRLRLVVRDFADHYGTGILKGLHLASE